MVIDFRCLCVLCVFLFLLAFIDAEQSSLQFSFHCRDLGKRLRGNNVIEKMKFVDVVVVGSALSSDIIHFDKL